MIQHHSIVINYIIKLQDAKKGRFDISKDDVKNSKKYSLIFEIFYSINNCDGNYHYRSKKF